MYLQIYARRSLTYSIPTKNLMIINEKEGMFGSFKIIPRFVKNQAAKIIYYPP